MAYVNNQATITIEAGQDLSTKQFHFVAVASDGQVDPCGDGARATGVLQNDPAAAGRAAEVAIGGVTKVLCGGTIAAGAAVASDSAGKAVAASTAGDIVLGVALQGGASGEVISIVFNPQNVVPA